MTTATTHKFHRHFLTHPFIPFI